MQEYVFLKGKKDRLVVQLEETVEFEVLREQFISKIKKAESFIGDNPIAIEFSKRKLSEVEEEMLLNDIQVNTNIKVVLLIADNQIFKELPMAMELLQKVDKKENEVKNEPILSKEFPTKLHKGTIRSGSVLEFNGNVVILGDVNPGAIIKATGSIVVLGYLNGSAHIETEEATHFVGALSLNPIQIKIGSVIAKNPSKDILDANKIRKDLDFEVAYLNAGKIYVEQFTKSTLEKIIK